jgi:hypothetical protein
MQMIHVHTVYRATTVYQQRRPSLDDELDSLRVGHSNGPEGI